MDAGLRALAKRERRSSGDCAACCYQRVAEAAQRLSASSAWADRVRTDALCCGASRAGSLTPAGRRLLTLRYEELLRIDGRLETVARGRASLRGALLLFETLADEAGCSFSLRAQARARPDVAPVLLCSARCTAAGPARLRVSLRTLHELDRAHIRTGLHPAALLVALIGYASELQAEEWEVAERLAAALRRDAQPNPWWRKHWWQSRFGARRRAARRPVADAAVEEEQAGEARRDGVGEAAPAASAAPAAPVAPSPVAASALLTSSAAAAPVVVQGVPVGPLPARAEGRPVFEDDDDRVTRCGRCGWELQACRCDWAGTLTAGEEEEEEEEEEGEEVGYEHESSMSGDDLEEAGELDDFIVDDHDSVVTDTEEEEEDTEDDYAESRGEAATATSSPARRGRRIVEESSDDDD